MLSRFYCLVFAGYEGACIFVCACTGGGEGGVVAAAAVPRFRACFPVQRLFSGYLGGDCRRPVSASVSRVFVQGEVRRGRVQGAHRQGGHQEPAQGLPRGDEKGSRSHLMMLRLLFIFFLLAGFLPPCSSRPGSRLDQPISITGLVSGGTEDKIMEPARGK